MTVKVIEKRPQSFALRIGIIAVIVLAMLGLAVRFLKPNKTEAISANKDNPFSGYSTLNDILLVPVIELEVQDRSKEKYWSEALANRIAGQTEVSVPYGRVDVLTGNYAIEVDFLHKWKEGIGQALHYATMTGITPCLALIIDRNTNQSESALNDELKQIEALCTSKGIRLVFLK